MTFLFCIQKAPGLLKANVMFYTQPVERLICLGVVKLGTLRNSEAGCAYQFSHLAAVLFMASREGKCQDLGDGGLIISYNGCKRLFF